MEVLSTLSDTGKKAIAIVCINLLFGLLGLFFYPTEAVRYVLLLPWLVYVLSMIGYVPFAGFLAYYWIYESVLMQMFWYDYCGLTPTSYTRLLWFIFQAYSLLLTLRSTGALTIPEQLNEIT